MNHATLSQEIETRARALAEDLAAIVRRDALAAVRQRLGAAAPSKAPGDREAAVLSVLRQVPNRLWKISQISAASGLSVRELRTPLLSLVRRQRVRKLGYRGGARYYVR